jgi:uncharacterized protein (TIGR03118 family)
MSQYQQINLVSDIDHYARITNPNLTNAWGLLQDIDGSFWIASNGAGLLLHLNRTYNQIASVNVPSANGTDTGSPSGIVFNNTQGFKISGSFIGPAKIIAVTEDGLITGFNPQIDPNNAHIAVTTPDAVYKGVALNGGWLFVANFHSGYVEKYDQNWNLVSTFTDNSLNNNGYSPFNIYSYKNYIYVTFAKRDDAGHDDVKGLGNGFVDIFSLDGTFVRRLINRGALNSPWGMFIDGEELYIGNFGDGRINVFNRKSGVLLFSIMDQNDNIIAVDGLWGILPQARGRCEKVKIYLTAGINDEDNGLFAVLE